MLTCDEALASVLAMRHREATDYMCGDYIPRNRGSRDGIDELCRKLMADWCIKVVDRCSFSRDTASIAMNMLDRFLNTAQGSDALRNRNLFQLASMTCLYTAIKVHESEALQPKTIVQLSRGMFTVKEIEAMELKVLFALKWRTSPPTAGNFVQHFLAAAPQESDDEHDQILKLATLQTELTLVDYAYATKKASSIAYAAIANAIDILGIANTGFMDVLFNCLGMDGEEVKYIQEKLMKQVHQQHEAQVVVATKSLRQLDVSKNRASDGGHSSPREVSSVNQKRAVYNL
ncbi:cyclin-like protein [Fragilaria crotonensis]|nr:cyclin-like protein [Fragilaria crotonensis]